VQKNSYIFKTKCNKIRIAWRRWTLNDGGLPNFSRKCFWTTELIFKYWWQKITLSSIALFHLLSESTRTKTHRRTVSDKLYRLTTVSINTRTTISNGRPNDRRPVKLHRLLCSQEDFRHFLYSMTVGV